MTKEEKAAYDRARYLANREEHLARARVAYQRNKGRYIENAARWARENPEKARRNKQAYKDRNKWRPRSDHVRAQYGITLEDERAMREAQAGCCAICGVYAARLCIDHCHDTGKVRGLLCRICNTALGGFMDSPDLLFSAVAYLEDTGTAKPFSGRAEPDADESAGHEPGEHEQLLLPEAVS